MQRRSLSCGLLLLVPGLLALGVLATGADPDPATRPTYTADGELKLPSGYHTWVYVGTDLAPQYKKNLPEFTGLDQVRHPTPRQGEQPGEGSDAFHNIYINMEAYDYFIRHGRKEFPEPTILMMELFRAESKDSTPMDPQGVLAKGQFEAERVNLLAAVKDKNRPKGGSPWAYYSFANAAPQGAGKPYKPAESAKAHPDEDCFNCHVKHASTDNVWVQFYPMLRDPELADPRHR